MTATPSVANKRSKRSKSEPKRAADAPPAESKPAGLKLPESLASYREQLVKALAVEMPWTWNEDDTYLKADQPQAIADVLRRSIHLDLLNAKLAVVFRKELKSQGRTRGAQASKVGGKLNYFTGYELLIEVNHEAWRWLTQERRVALIDHELCHFARNEDGTGYTLVPHDVEEFGLILRRWGLWEPGVARFASAIDRARQLDIFASPIAAADKSVN